MSDIRIFDTKNITRLESNHSGTRFCPTLRSLCLEVTNMSRFDINTLLMLVTVMIIFYKLRDGKNAYFWRKRMENIALAEIADVTSMFRDRHS